MKSIKPGRGPSAMGAIGSVAVGLFGVFWTFQAASMGAPSIFVFFGVIFVGLAIVQGVFHFKNATGTKRMSLYDITDADEVPNVIDNEVNNSNNVGNQADEVGDINYCPFCGNKVTDTAYKFCSNCGKQIAD